MSSNPNVLGYYLYSLVAIGVFIYNCRNWKFLRVTLLYYIFITFFAYLLIYGSAYKLESNLDQLQQQGLLSAFPFTISGAGPDVNTVPKTSPNFFPWTLTSISFFATFPQAVMRGLRLSLKKPQSLDKIFKKIWKDYKNIRENLRDLGIIILPVINDIYIVGEWVFVLVTISSLASPFPMHSWYLMLLGCFFILIITGSDITNGIEEIIELRSPLTTVLKWVAPGIIRKLRDFSIIVLHWSIVLVSVGISIISGFILFNIITNILHTKNIGAIATIIIFAAQIGLLLLSYKYLSKAIAFVIAKLIHWMGYQSE